MENKNKKKNNNMNVIIIVVIVVLAIIVGVVLGLGRKSNEKELDSSLKEMGKSFYENFYYEQVGSSADERSSLLSKFTTVGIKIDLDNLGRYNSSKNKDKVAEFINTSTKKECDKNETRAIIYPKSPYGKTDYTVKAELDCGFGEK